MGDTNQHPQLPHKRPHIPTNRDHKAINRGTLGGSRNWTYSNSTEHPNNGRFKAHTKLGPAGCPVFKASSRPVSC